MHQHVTIWLRALEYYIGFYRCLQYNWNNVDWYDKYDFHIFLINILSNKNGWS